MGWQVLLLLFAALATQTPASPAGTELPPPIPREVFFPKPAAMQALRLSPDGRFLSYIASDPSGVPQLWVRELDTATTRQLTTVPAGIGLHTWAENSRVIVYDHREGGGSRLVGLEVSTGAVRTLAQLDGARFGTFLVSPHAADELLITVRMPNATDEDVYRLNVNTGAFALDTRNPGGVPGNQFLADPALRVRAVQRMKDDGSAEVLVRDGPDSPWRTWLTADATYMLSIEAFSGDGEALLLRTDLGGDMARLVSRPIRGGPDRVIASAQDLDIENVLLHPRTGAVQAVSFLSEPRRWEATDPSIAREFTRIGTLVTGKVAIGVAGRDRADARWLVWLSSDRSSRRCYVWDRATRRGTLVFEEQPELSKLPLAEMRPISFTARDGFRITGYLILPVAIPDRGLPLVVWVHGGPYLRDAWGYDRLGQFFASRGYAFLRVNFRGSRGFGRQNRLASFKQWGGTMQHDVLDAVEFVVRSGTVDRSRMAITGHSYGGYSALAALAMTPDLFACGAASSTTTNVLEFVKRFSRTAGNVWVRETIGDEQIAADAEMLRRVSPLTHVDRVTRPMLIARGDRDDAIPPGDMETFAAELDKRSREITTVVYEGDGHFFRRENELDYFARVEALFARCLGGRAEPLAGDRYPGSTGRVKPPVLKSH